MAESLLQRAAKKIGVERLMAELNAEQRELVRYLWEAVARPEQLTPDGNWTGWLILAGRGFGKALSVDTPVPTPGGWSTMGDLRDGDAVFDERGGVCRVIEAHAVMFDRPCYRLTFSDSTSIVSDSEHLWLTTDKRARGSMARAAKPRHGPSIVTTEEIADSLRAGGDVNHAVSVAAPLQLPEAQLPIHPYVLGVWLGDGDSKAAVITSADEEVFKNIERCGVAVGAIKRDTRSRAMRASIGRESPSRNTATGKMQANGSMHSKLDALGVLRAKHIPTVYLRASAKQRFELLYGLMDSDGSCSLGGHVEYCGTNEALCNGVLELVRSLGFKPTMGTGRAMINGKDCGVKYRVTWTPCEPVFKLKRKLLRQRVGKLRCARNSRRYIVGAELVKSVPVRCITVDSQSRLYLAGHAMIPTHNTRTGAEQVRRWIRDYPHVNLIGATVDDARDIMVEGESGILAICPPHERPVYRKSDRQLVWPNGAKSLIFTADEPERLRGKQHMKVWADEVGSWRYDESWEQMEMGLRLGDNPQWVATTTPRPNRLIRRLVSDPVVHVTRGRTHDNKANLADNFFATIIKKYEGTRLGRQELDAEILEDVEGALWTHAVIEAARIQTKPPLRRTVVAVDPAISANSKSDETGIIVCGISATGEGHVVADYSGRYTPDQWANIVIKAYHEHRADRIVAEKNQGGNLVEANIRTVYKAAPITLVHASKGKYTRAEPIAALYEQGRVHHVGCFAKLEDQMCAFDGNPESHDSSPDRVDALVWGLTDLMLGDSASFGSADWKAPPTSFGAPHPEASESPLGSWGDDD